MADDQKKRNVYAILFFLALLFVAIGFERNGAISGQVPLSATYPETWFITCNVPTTQAAGDDLGRTLYETYGCARVKPTIYCQQAADGINLPNKVSVRVSCTSLGDKQAFVRACEDTVNTLCATPSSRTATRR